MSERRISKVASSTTRTSDGKKIDTWKVSLPDGASDIAVSLHANRDEILFRAKGTHPAIKGLEWEGTDLAALREEVISDVEKAARRYFSEDWQPAVAVEASLYKTDREDRLKVQVSFDMIDIHVDPAKPMGNQGETHVLKGQVPTVMIQRSHDQRFEVSGTWVDRDVMRFRQEQGNTVSRAIVDESDRDRVLALSRSIEAFSVALMRRMAPDAVRFEGIPSPDELVEVMRRAVEEPELSEEQSDPAFDP